MNKKPDAFKERLKKMPLWQWGLIIIFSGLITGMLMGLSAPPGRSAEARAAALGQSIAVLLFVIAGIVLIILHFVRRKRR